MATYVANLPIETVWEKHERNLDIDVVFRVLEAWLNMKQLE